jgi:hypothetical protein
MRLDRDRLMAFADGELSAAEAREVAGKLAREPELAAFVERQKALRRALRNSFEPVLAAPLPPALARAVTASARPTMRARLGAARRRMAERRPPLRAVWLPFAGALAAGAILGAVLTGIWRAEPSLRGDGGGLLADGRLAEALTSRLAAEARGDAGMRIGVSFRAEDGRYCRSFTTLVGAEGLAGIACREREHWRIAALLSFAGPGSGEYESAAAALPEPLRRIVDAMRAGAPLDAAGERAARDRGWRAGE